MENAPASGTPGPKSQGSSSDPLLALRQLHAAGGALFTQMTLHGKLMSLEWAAEKNRLLNMLVVILLGIASVICVMLTIAALVLAFSWNTSFRVPSVIGLLAFYLLLLHICWRHFKELSALGSKSFAASRQEIAADIAVFRGKL